MCTAWTSRVSPSFRPVLRNRAWYAVRNTSATNRHGVEVKHYKRPDSRIAAASISEVLSGMRITAL